MRELASSPSRHGTASHYARRTGKRTSEPLNESSTAQQLSGRSRAQGSVAHTAVRIDDLLACQGAAHFALGYAPVPGTCRLLARKCAKEDTALLVWEDNFRCYPQPQQAHTCQRNLQLWLCSSAGRPNEGGCKRTAAAEQPSKKGVSRMSNWLVSVKYSSCTCVQMQRAVDFCIAALKQEHLCAPCGNSEPKSIDFMSFAFISTNLCFLQQASLRSVQG